MWIKFREGIASPLEKDAVSRGLCGRPRTDYKFSGTLNICFGEQICDKLITLKAGVSEKDFVSRILLYFYSQKSTFLCTGKQFREGSL